MADRTVTTLHGRQDLPDLKPLYLGFREMPLVSISDAPAASRSPKANFVGNRTPRNSSRSVHGPIYDPRGGYVAFLGRISPEKRPDRAIRIAQTLGIPLKIAAKVDTRRRSLFPRPRSSRCCSDPGVEFIGEINERSQSRSFSVRRRALLFPVDWPEPFGIVMIEAMACGTPVLAFRCGSVPEIVDNGVTGQIVDTEEEAIRQLPQVLSLDRRAVRRRFEQRFSASRMAKDYIQVYRSLVKRPFLLPDAVPNLSVVRPITKAEVN